MYPSLLEVQKKRRAPAKSVGVLYIIFFDKCPGAKLSSTLFRSQCRGVPAPPNGFFSRHETSLVLSASLPVANCSSMAEVGAGCDRSLRPPWQQWHTHALVRGRLSLCFCFTPLFSHIFLSSHDTPLLLNTTFVKSFLSSA